MPKERRARYTRWPKPRMAICGWGLQPDCFVPMEFDFNLTNRNLGRPSRNAVWFLCSPYQMGALWVGYRYGGVSLIKNGTVTDYGKTGGASFCCGVGIRT